MKDTSTFRHTFGISTAVAALYAAMLTTTAGAQTHQAIINNCKETVGRAIVQSCMAQTRDFAKCRERATPPVRACVIAAERKIAAGKAAPAAPVEKATEAGAKPVATGFVAPPRTIADITSVLDKEKPDAARIAERKEDAEATPPKGGSASDMSQFYYDRGNARALLARTQEALADALKAQEVAERGVDTQQRTRIAQFVAMQYMAAGKPKEAIATMERVVRNSDASGARGSLISASLAIARANISIGDVGQADAYVRRVMSRVQEARGSPHPNWRKAYQVYGNTWEATLDSARGLIFETRGQYREAEAAYRRAVAFRRATLKNLDQWDYPPPPEQILLAADDDLLSLARMQARQGRVSEAEVDARRALLGVLNNQGKYNPVTPKFVLGLASILIDQSRYPEAEQLARSALEIQGALGFAEDSTPTAGALSQLGSILTLQRKSAEAADIYARLERAVANWEPRRRDIYLLNAGRIMALYASGQIDAGVDAARELVKRQTARAGDDHFDVAAARSLLGVGYARAGRDAEALQEFKISIPVMMAAMRENADDDDASVEQARRERLRASVEIYIGLLAKAENASDSAAVETFSLADVIRGRSVQQALSASSARSAAKDPALAELVRTEQDLGKQINAGLGTLNNLLSLPSNERDENVVRGLNSTIEKLRADRIKARQNISRRFPAYADLVDPKPPTLDEIRASLTEGEALLSFYFGREKSFAWAVPKSGAVAFAAIPATSGDVEAKVRKLREALEPQATLISDIPPFDVKLAYELYDLLLKPVEPGWKSATRLIAVTNGAMGLLPLALLPTAEVAEVSDGEPAFNGYRNVPWLIRTHAVTSVPSAAALRTLRLLPKAPEGRERLIGFGDPLFSKEQKQSEVTPMQTAMADLTTRAPLKRRSGPQLAGVDSAELALLPRLPDTADELKSIALALEADPSKVLNLGEKANERAVKTTDLSKYKVLVFATHGLVPGELNGLTQPALALSAPDVAGVEGDGLLTMEEILALKLNADWVVLSACNTGAGAGAGAEAASGLGRAFFYAGTRALLVTNWSVHSQSARELTSDLFARQAADPKLSRSEALRLAMVAMIDRGSAKDGTGAIQYTYAHPLFWAPFTIIGDGG